MSPPRPIALTLGDPAGIGPEIALRLLAEGDLPSPVLLVGSREALLRDEGLVEGAEVPPAVPDPESLAARGLQVGVLDTPARHERLPRHGVVDAEAGRASHAWVLKGARLALEGRVAGLVTGPIHKAAWQRAGVPHPGHTEMLQAVARSRRVLMLMVGGRLRAALATIHVPLSTVASRLTVEGLLQDLELLAAGVRRHFGPERPRIAVAGLNPHAGEEGLFGQEEARVIRPAVEAAVSQGLDVVGPLPADACLPAAVEGAYDAVLAMYHDQALPVVKAVARRRAVNVTLGLPFVRTSVDHGTAFDIAGRGVATADSLRAALELATRMTARSGER